MIDRFFRPFLGGIFFNRRLTVTSRLFTFVMRMLATGSNCLPAAGIGAVADQIAAGLPAGSVRLDTRVASVSSGGVKTESGAEVTAARGVVVAVEGPEAQRLLQGESDTQVRASPGVAPAWIQARWGWHAKCPPVCRCRAARVWAHVACTLRRPRLSCRGTRTSSTSMATGAMW